MLKTSMCLTTDIGSLCDAVNQRYHWKIDDYDLCQVLFGEDYSNYSYKSHYFTGADWVYHGYKWENEHQIDVYNKVNRFLREIFPNEERILIDVSW